MKYYYLGENEYTNKDGATFILDFSNEFFKDTTPIKTTKKAQVALNHNFVSANHLAARLNHYRRELAREARSRATTARVVWFDKLAGEGLVKTNLGDSMPLWGCNIKGAKTGYCETACVYLKAGTEIDIHIDHDLVVCDTQGLIDVEKWEQIKDKSLAFRKDESGKFTTGLFAKGA